MTGKAQQRKKKIQPDAALEVEDELEKRAAHSAVVADEFMARHPEVQLLQKLAALAVHAEEYLEAIGINLDVVAYDRAAIEAILDDAEVKAFLRLLDMRALLPKKHDLKGEENDESKI